MHLWQKCVGRFAKRLGGCWRELPELEVLQLSDVCQHKRTAINAKKNTNNQQQHKNKFNDCLRSTTTTTITTTFQACNNRGSKWWTLHKNEALTLGIHIATPRLNMHESKSMNSTCMIKLMSTATTTMNIRSRNFYLAVCIHVIKKKKSLTCYLWFQASLSHHFSLEEAAAPSTTDKYFFSTQSPLILIAWVHSPE